MAKLAVGTLSPDTFFIVSRSRRRIATMRTLSAQPDPVSACIASSPSFHANDKCWPRNVDRMFRAEPLKNTTLFMTVGRDDADLTRYTCVCSDNSVIPSVAR